MIRNRGIALIIVSSLLVLLVVAAASLLSLASGLRQRSAVNIDQETARLLARSGVSYAGARLSDPSARSEAADDWAFRDDPSTPLERSLNPSYAHGEPYQDLYPLGGNGKYDPGPDPYTDLTGNGRFDVWSGRLRGRHGLADATFALKIASTEAKLDINGGTLSMEDTDHYKGPDYNDWLAADQRQPYAPGFDDLPTARGMQAILNMHSSEVINLLGEVIYDTEHDTGRKPPLNTLPTNMFIQINAPPSPQTSLMQVGDLLLQTRLPGGYRTLAEARRAVIGKSTTAGPITREDWEKIEPYLSTQGSRTGSVWGKACNPPPRVDRVQAIDVNTADRFLLQALFLSYLFDVFIPAYGYPPASELTREDTERIADFLIAGRPFVSRYDLFRKLDAAKGTVFPAPAYDLLKQNAAVNLVAAMAEGVSGAVAGPARVTNDSSSCDYSFNQCSDFPLFSWITYDLPRKAPSGGEARRARFFQEEDCLDTRVIRPAGYVYWAQLLPLSLDSGELPFSVSVESLGQVGEAGSRRAAATLYVPTTRAADIVESTSQNDFENQEERIRSWEGDSSHPPTTAWEYVWLKIRETRRLEGGVELRGRPGKHCTQTWPGYPLDSCPDYIQGSEMSLSQHAIADYFPRDHLGNVALMPYAGRTYGDEFFYMPCWEKGQPLRDPSEPRASRDNFANLISDPPSVYGAAPAPWTNAQFGPLFARRPTTIPNPTTHQWEASHFPCVDSAGVFQGGTFDYWGIGANMDLSSGTAHLSIGIDSNDSSAVVTAREISSTGSSSSYKSVGLYAPHTPHRTTLVLGGVVQGYVDGLPDPGLFGNPQKNALDSTQRFGLLMESGALRGNPVYRGSLGDLAGGVRAFAEQWGQDKVRSAALQDPYFWTSEAHPDVTEIPSYTSPLYVFPHPARLTSASWDGFVPAKIRDALGQASFSQGNRQAPLRVELLMYADERAVPGTERILPLPAEGWRTGGESVDLGKEWARSHSGDRLPPVRSFKYRVWFDASAMGAPGNETPVFNSIRIGYRSKGGFLSVSEE